MSPPRTTAQIAVASVAFGRDRDTGLKDLRAHTAAGIGKDGTVHSRAKYSSCRRLTSPLPLPFRAGVIRNGVAGGAYPRRARYSRRAVCTREVNVGGIS